jgi:hypothetical protein
MNHVILSSFPFPRLPSEIALVFCYPVMSESVLEGEASSCICTGLQLLVGFFEKHFLHLHHPLGAQTASRTFQCASTFWCLRSTE